MGRTTYIHQVVGKASAEIDVGTPTTPVRVGAAEEALGVKLPESYKQFLLTCGSASIESEEIFGLDPEDHPSDFVQSTLFMRRAKDFRWPDHMLVIAADGRGGDYCLDVSGIKDGDCPVVYHDHELDEIDEDTGAITPSFEKVKPTFAAWLKQVATTGSMLPE
jgi:hypothetical protein